MTALEQKRFSLKMIRIETKNHVDEQRIADSDHYFYIC